MADAVKENGIVFQTGSQQRSEYGGTPPHCGNGTERSDWGTQKRYASASVASKPCDLPTEPTPEGIDWDAWLGPAPMGLIRFSALMMCTITSLLGRRYCEYCNGGLADIGAHHFDIGQWAMDADNTGPVKVIPPGEGERDLKMVYATELKYIMETHRIGGGTIFYGTEGTIWVDRGPWKSDPENLINDYKATVSLRQPKNHHDDWLDCIHNGELLAHAEAGHRTATLCQLLQYSDTNYAANLPGIRKKEACGR